jgi:hypothetical protein
MNKVHSCVDGHIHACVHVREALAKQFGNAISLRAPHHSVAVGHDMKSM